MEEEERICIIPVIVVMPSTLSGFWMQKVRTRSSTNSVLAVTYTLRIMARGPAMAAVFTSSTTWEPTSKPVRIDWAYGSPKSTTSNPLLIPLPGALTKCVNTNLALWYLGLMANMVMQITTMEMIWNHAPIVLRRPNHLVLTIETKKWRIKSAAVTPQICKKGDRTAAINTQSS